MMSEGIARNYPKGYVIICEGDYSDLLYFVLSGSVRVYIGNANGKEVMLNTIKEGDYFGEFILDGGPRTASVITAEPTRLFITPQHAIEKLIGNNQQFTRDLISRLLNKVRSLSEKLHDFSMLDVRGRLLAYIDAHAEDTEEGRVLEEVITHQELASRIGTSREMVTRMLKKLGEEGYISIEDRRIHVLHDLEEVGL